ncbi:unnamed protein product [Sphagnum jensenii]|uniref:Uncharacterized protein n=1 Tax=Sphagnum jensenii TaxID=128206 RepID=A0ABP0WJB1_9BRYO
MGEVELTFIGNKGVNLIYHNKLQISEFSLTLIKLFFCNNPSSYYCEWKACKSLA